MNTSNPLEIMLMIFIAILSVFLIERIIAKAFKTVILGLLLFIGVFAYSLHRHNVDVRHKTPTYKFTVHDLIDYSSFKSKLSLYGKETLKDVRYDFNQAKKNVQKH
jgi:hypothetical protein